MKKEKRWVANEYEEVFLADVLIDEEDNIVLYSVEDEDYYNPPKDAFLFFQTKEEAEEKRNQLIPQNIEQVRGYIRYLFGEANEEELNKILPENVYKHYLEGCCSHRNLSYAEFLAIKDAITGRLNLSGYSFRPEQIVAVRFQKDEDYNLTVILSNGKELTTRNEVERDIIRALVGDNHSKVRYNR